MQLLGVAVVSGRVAHVRALPGRLVPNLPILVLPLGQRHNTRNGDAPKISGVSVIDID